MTPLFATTTARAASWLVRGEQVASFLDARCITDLRDVPRAPSGGVAVVVKRAELPLFDILRAAGWRIVWDCVDFWPQSLLRPIDYAQALKKLATALFERVPDGVIASSMVMKRDVLKVLGPAFPCEVIPHHYHPQIRVSEPRQFDARPCVGYCGRVDYIAPWIPELKAWCESRGGLFILAEDPRAMRRMQPTVLVAARTGAWDTAPAALWKSNVKQATAWALAVPFVATWQDSYMHHGTELLPHASTVERMIQCLLKLHTERAAYEQYAFEAFIQAETVSPETVAAMYRQFLRVIANA